MGCPEHPDERDKEAADEEEGEVVQAILGGHRSAMAGVDGDKDRPIGGDEGEDEGHDCPLAIVPARERTALR